MKEHASSEPRQTGASVRARSTIRPRRPIVRQRLRQFVAVVTSVTRSCVEPIAVGSTKCSVPATIFLSRRIGLDDLRRVEVARPAAAAPSARSARASASRSAAGSAPRATASSAAASIPYATASPCRNRRYFVTASSAWPAVWPKFRIRRGPTRARPFADDGRLDPAGLGDHRQQRARFAREERRAAPRATRRRAHGSRSPRT